MRKFIARKFATNSHVKPRVFPLNAATVLMPKAKEKH